MFGYITVNKDTLSEENKKIYQSYYCGLCQTMKSQYGRRAQMALNYDMTFLIVLLTGLYEPDSVTRDGFVCSVHPTKKRTLRTNEITEYAAAMNILLAYYNLIDDWKDDKSLTKKTYAEMLKQDEWQKDLKEFGCYMGKFIYIMDAYEDIGDDVKKKSYNPLIQLMHCCNNDQEKFDKSCRLMMTSMLSEAAKIFERLPILLHADIIRNVLYSGVWSKYEYIQMKKRKKHK